MDEASECLHPEAFFIAPALGLEPGFHASIARCADEQSAHFGGRRRA
jgi:hypothetical protein